MYTGPKIKTEGLVFGYDTGYKVLDSITSTRFAKGEPAKNLLYPFESWWNNGYTTTLVSIDPPFSGAPVYQITKTGTSVLFRDGTIGGSGYSGNTSFPNIGDGTFKYSIWVKGNSQTTSSNCYIDIGDRNVVSTDITKDTPWTHIKTDDSAGVVTGTYDFCDIQLNGLTGNTCYVSTIMLTSGSSSYPTYLTPSTERSSTESLLDLTGTTEIDTSKLVFNSEGQPTWNNTTSWIDLGNTSTFQLTGNVTVECVCNPVSGDGNMFSMNGNSGYRIRILTGGDFWIYSNGNSVQSAGPSYGKYNHCVGVFSSTGLRAYVNGKLVASNGTAFSPAAYGSIGAYVGAFNTSSELFNGEIPVMKIYNTALTEQEIQENFRAYRSRFNI